LWRMTAILALVLFAFSGYERVRAGEQRIDPLSYPYFDFPTCVRYALVHSEDFLKNRLEIQIRSSDLKDAHGDLAPTFLLTTNYYFQRVDDINSNNPNPSKVNVQILMKWNPYEALVKIKSNSILVDIAKIRHFDSISKNIGDMAKLFYGIHTLEKQLKIYKQVVALKNNKVKYGKSRDDQGNQDPLTLRAWTNDVRSSAITMKTLEKTIADLVSKLKILMGYQPDCHLPLDTRDAANQILAGFNGDVLTFADIQASNFDLKTAAKKEQLQSSILTGKYLLLVPLPMLIFDDNKNTPNAASGINFGIGVTIPIWDGFKRVRDIKRQKLMAESFNLDRKLLSQKIYSTFGKLRDDINLCSERESFIREQGELAELTEEKSLQGYQAGHVEYSDYMDRRVSKVESQLNSVDTARTRVESLVDMATLAGGLNRYNAAIKY
jgi:outer membrane protein TolC